MGIYDKKGGFNYDNRTRRVDTTDLWIVPYADFMSVLMVLFLIMFVFAYTSKKDRRYNELMVSIQTEMGGTVTKDVLDEMKDTEKTEQTVLKFDEMLENQNLTKYVSVSYDTEQIKIIMKNPVLFDIGQVELRKESEAILHEMALILKNTENDVIVEGHTDNIPVRGYGKYKSNWEISQRRAIEVIKYFLNREGLNPARFAAAGYGEFRPVFPNDTPDHRNQNRRIEINVLRGKAKT
jgi:chemotaxis protein MotB